MRDYGTAQWDGGSSECDHDQRRQPKDGKQSTNEGASRDPLRDGPCRWCGAIRIDDQIGLEPTPEAYVGKMVAVFSEVRRVLRSDGTLWLNLGDSYASAWATSRRSVVGEGSLVDGSRNGGQRPNRLSGDVKEKDLVGIPWMVAFALRADGWYLRSDIIWSKPNPMPESVTDRPTKSHEYIFLLTKSAKYFFDQEAIKEKAIEGTDLGLLRGKQQSNDPNISWHAPSIRARQDAGVDSRIAGTGYRNIRSVWNIATQPFSEAHFATFPERLVDRCISAGTSEKGVCGECGKSWARIIERVEGVTHQREPAYAPNSCPTKVDSTGWQPSTRATDQWQQQCEHDALPIPATVLDIFSGSGTSGVVARKLGRNYIGIELNPQYVAMSERRLRGTIYQPGLFGE